MFDWLCNNQMAVLDVVLVFAAVAAIVIGTQSMPDPDDQAIGTASKVKPIDNMMDYVGILMWPVIWDITVGFGIVQQFPLTFIGFIWPMMLIFLDLYSSSPPTDESPAKYDQLVGNIRIDGTAVITISFAMAGLLLSSDKNVSSISSSMIMFALLFVVAFVVPVNDVHMSATSKLIMYSMQRIFLNFAIGFVITGIAVNLSFVMNVRSMYEKHPVPIQVHHVPVERMAEYAESMGH